MIRGVFFGKVVMLYPRTYFFSLLQIRAVNEGSRYLATEVSFPKTMSKAVIGQSAVHGSTRPDCYETQEARECSTPFLFLNPQLLCQNRVVIQFAPDNLAIVVEAAMGTHKGSKIKNASLPSTRTHKSLSTSKEPTSVARKTKSWHFPAFSFVGTHTEWQEWEDQLIVRLRKEGKTGKQISQHLPGRTTAACTVRFSKIKACNERIGTQRKDPLAFRAPPPKQVWRKEWEDWEHQLIITHHSAGYSWNAIAEMLPPRTAGSVRAQWYRFLKPESQDTASTTTSKTERAFWTQKEDQILISLRESGKSWAEIATQLDRTQRSCSGRWHGHHHKPHGPPRVNGLPWAEWEERLLVSGYYAGLSWKEISETIGRPSNSPKAHWTEYFCSPDEDEPWTSEEGALLETLRWRGSAWDEISQELPRHTSNACRTQWYKVTEGIQSPSSHPVANFWSAEEVEVLVSLYNTIGPRWQEICKHIPGRTWTACHSRLYECTEEDGLGGPPSQFWQDFFMSELHPNPRKPFSPQRSEAEFLRQTRAWRRGLGT